MKMCINRGDNLPKYVFRRGSSIEVYNPAAFSKERLSMKTEFCFAAVLM